jgi:hypothetical protein
MGDGAREKECLLVGSCGGVESKLLVVVGAAKLRSEVEKKRGIPHSMRAASSSTATTTPHHVTAIQSRDCLFLLSVEISLVTYPHFPLTGRIRRVGGAEQVISCA